MLGTLQKAGLILDLYTPQRPEWGVTEVARTLDWPPSSAHLLLTSLVDLGVLHRTAAGRYRLGFRLLGLTRILLANTPWRDIAATEMQALRAAHGETVTLLALDGGTLIRVEALPGTLGGSVPPPSLGVTPPLHATASGKLLAALRPHEVTLDDPLPACTPATCTSRHALDGELHAVRETGLAFSLQEYRAGVCSVAAPVRNHNGEVIAALTLSAPTHRFRRQVHATATEQAAARISGRIGFDPQLRGPDAPHWASVEGRDQLRPSRRTRTDPHR